ncbi:inorganic diphosphatase [Candidatus Blochmannia ocreatus (nom. nud.)]|uniref:Inorganic pyrophosphatase n=1 Tax=Candidatus Blochmannia ocreatus (nom. nud.) TaxID=251538 RepID=A0ABY4ST63_9ENTR|nr:inorganic diphosphatase [Candidatus Blochmannia ocreatus]URJ25176.1 inorganic diphosphatase [Candidatus Blochmannia ocreatus]
MYLNQIKSGKNIPHDIYVVVEIPANSSPVKYEIDKKTGAIFVDRFLSVPMFYPCNYGYINHTLALDGDPVDAIVLTPYPIISGCIIFCRPIGLLNMVDESGEDSKIFAVPHDKISQLYSSIQDIDDLPNLLLEQINYFFKNYKALDSEKWVKIKNWEHANTAKKIILDAADRFKKANNVII